MFPVQLNFLTSEHAYEILDVFTSVHSEYSNTYVGEGFRKFENKSHKTSDPFFFLHSRNIVSRSVVLTYHPRTTGGP